MRDDPIVFEDWKVGRSNTYLSKNKKWLNSILTILFSLVQIIIGLFIGNATIVFTWLFIIMIALVLEILVEQFTNSVLMQVLFIFGLLFISLLTTPIDYFIYQDQLFSFINLISGSIVLIKLIIIYLIGIEIHFSEHILEPRSDYARIILDEQVLRVQDTEYEIISEESFRTPFNEFINHYKVELIGSGIFIAVIAIAGYLLGDVFFLAFSITISFISSMLLITMLFAWLRIKAEGKKVKIAEIEEIIPVFADFKLDEFH